MLEQIQSCPICKATAHCTEHIGVTDDLHRSGNEKWKYDRCLACQAVFLNPRPTEQSIGSYYARMLQYPKTTPVDYSKEPKHPVRDIARGTLFGYLNRRYGYKMSPDIGPLATLAALLPGFKKRAGDYIRELPSKNEGGAGTLLDIGCGPGLFLFRMKQFGWNVEGLEMSPTEAEKARALGITVHPGSLTTPPRELQGRTFDAITLGDVIEHLHDPLKDLKKIFDLLNPNGVLYIQTPNAESLGRSIFKEDWFALQPPYHLILFTAKNIELAAKSAGFEKIMVRDSSAYGSFTQQSIARGALNNSLSTKQRILGSILSLPGANSLLNITLGTRAWDGIVAVFRKPY